MILYMVKTPSWPVDRFRELIDHILRETELPQAQLAALIPMDQSQLSRWKSGSSKPKPESLQSLGKALALQYPELGIGPAELIECVYPRNDEQDVREASTTPTEAADVVPPNLDDIKAQTALERVLLEAIQAVHEEVRQLREQVQDLKSEREPDQPNDARNRNSA